MLQPDQVQIVRDARDSLGAALVHGSDYELREAARTLVDTIDLHVLPSPAAIIVDESDGNWAYAEMPDGTWRLHERTSDETVWLEVEQCSTYADAVNARDRRQARREVADTINRYVRNDMLGPADELARKHGFTPEELNRY